MNFISTRNTQESVTLEQALQQGLASDGGLFVPETFPTISIAELNTTDTYPEFANKLLFPFFENTSLVNQLSTICNNAFNFSVPLHALTDNTYYLELFHGPTLSFKDFGARFLAECLNQIVKQHTTIMVATSGDTGSAVAAAFDQKQHIDVIVLFPAGKISTRQEKQITCWSKNVSAFAVEGTFDDCQRMVKTAFHDPVCLKRFHLSTANSINIGRLLPQMVYYAYHSLQHFNKHRKQLGFVVPSGNLGNVTACYWAKTLGFPIREIVIATNANRVINDYLTTGDYSPRHSIETLANAMDVGAPSNFERLSYLLGDFEHFKQCVTAYTVTDKEIETEIRRIYDEHNYIICPHTATASWARQQLSSDPWAIIATADPAKFETIVEPLIGETVPIPGQLQRLLDGKHSKQAIKPSLEALIQGIDNR